MEQVTATDAFPLRWPEGYERTRQRERSRFKGITLGRARDELLHELRLLGARTIVLSTNMPVKKDGLFYAVGRVDDPGVAAYFTVAKRIEQRPGVFGSTLEQRVIPCDFWDGLADNVHAITLSVAAMRGLKRWGAGQVMERAFAAFKALPPSGEDWRTVFADALASYRGGGNEVMLDCVKASYRDLARTAHPDLHGGNDAEMVRLNQAMAAAKAELGR